MGNEAYQKYQFQEALKIGLFLNKRRLFKFKANSQKPPQKKSRRLATALR